MKNRYRGGKGGSSRKTDTEGEGGGVHEKPTQRGKGGTSRKTDIKEGGGDFLKRGAWTVCREREVVFLRGGGRGGEGVDTPMYTMEYLCKITTSSYVCLKAILKNNLEEVTLPFLKSFKKNMFEKHGHVSFFNACI